MGKLKIAGKVKEAGSTRWTVRSTGEGRRKGAPRSRASQAEGKPLPAEAGVPAKTRSGPGFEGNFGQSLCQKKVGWFAPFR